MSKIVDITVKKIESNAGGMMRGKVMSAVHGKKENDWEIRTFGINSCISKHVENHRIIAMGIVAMKKKLRLSYDKQTGMRLADETQDCEKRLLSCRKDMRENKEVIRSLCAWKQKHTNVIDLQRWKRRR